MAYAAGNPFLQAQDTHSVTQGTSLSTMQDGKGLGITAAGFPESSEEAQGQIVMSLTVIGMICGGSS